MNQNHTIAPAVAILLSMTLLIFLFVYNARKKEQKSKMKLIKEFQEFADSNNISASHTETFRNRIVGFDEKTKVLLYVTHRNNAYYSTQTQLDKNFSVELVKVGSSSRASANGRYTEFNLKEVQLHVTSSKEPDAVITLYSEIEDGAMSLMEHTQIAEKWMRLLLSHS